MRSASLTRGTQEAGGTPLPLNSANMEDILEAISAVRPPLRLCAIAKGEGKSCGFHLSRTQWDPYPWISNVDEASPAAEAGLKIGDFVIEVNGEDILGLRIDEVAQKVRLKSDTVRLLVWKSAVSETENKLPAVFNLQKFSSFLQSTLQLIECPVCMDIASSPTYQCINGHILCASCRIKTVKCPMCRVPLTGKGRCLVVEKLHRLIKKTLSVKSETTKAKEGDDADDTTRESAVLPTFHCPWSKPCQEMLHGENAVLQHLQKHHSGPSIQYNVRSDSVTVFVPPNPSSIYIARHDNIFFVRLLNLRECWLSVLGDASKAAQMVFSVKTREATGAHTAFKPVSSLCEPTATTLSRGNYMTLPSSATEMLITIVESKVIQNT